MMFLRTLTYSLFAYLTAVDARVVRAPLEKRIPKTDVNIGFRQNYAFGAPNYHRDQQAIRDNHHHGKTPLDFIYWGYGLDITVGIPQQHITVLLDINWSTFFVQSSYCDTYMCSRNSLPTFNRTASSAYFPIYQEAWVHYANGAKFGGNISTDYVFVAGVDIPELFFLDANIVEPIAWVAFYSGYTGVLGLSRNSSSSRINVSSAWEMLVGADWLDKNVFSISPPQRGDNPYEPRDPGELILGEYPKNFKKENAIGLPLRDGIGAWASTLESIRFGPNLTEQFEDGLVYFTTIDAAYRVPEYWFWDIVNATGADFRDGAYASVNCSKRGELPSWTLGIGGLELVVNAFQYTGVVNKTEDDCGLAILPGENAAVGLGGLFLENFMNVFDADEGKVFVAEIPRDDD